MAGYKRKNLGMRPANVKSPGGKKVAIIGSLPAGLSCAGELVKRGNQVTVFEALHEIGGVLIYGIPEFRLPKEIVHAEVGAFKERGVDFRKNAVICFADTIDQLMAEEGYDAVFIGVGAGLPDFMNIPGENLNGVYSDNEFLTRINLIKACRFPELDTPVFDIKDKNVVVFNCGDTAMDAVRSSKGLVAKTASVICRRREVEIQASKKAVHHAKQEGIKFVMLTNHPEFIGDENGWLRAV